MLLPTDFTQCSYYLGNDWYKTMSYEEYLKKKDELTKEKKGRKDKK